MGDFYVHSASMQQLLFMNCCTDKVDFRSFEKLVQKKNLALTADFSPSLLSAYLAVGDGVEYPADLSRCVHLIFAAGKRVRGSQGVQIEHPLDVVQNDLVFL